MRSNMEQSFLLLLGILQVIWLRPLIVMVTHRLHNAMVEGDFQAYVWWYIRRSYGPMKEDGTISKRGYNMAHFSKFVRPGYVRIDATKNPNANVYVSAYKGDNKVVIVAINKSNTGVNQNFVLQNGSASNVSRWITAAAIYNLERISLYQAIILVHLPAQSVTTFVVNR